MQPTPYKSRRRRALALAAAILLAAPWLWLAALDLLFPFPWERLQRPPAVVVADRQGEPLRVSPPAVAAAPARCGGGGDGPPGRALVFLPAGTLAGAPGHPAYRTASGGAAG